MKKFKITTLLLLLILTIFNFKNVYEDHNIIIDAQTDNERMLKAVWVSPIVADVSLRTEATFKSNMTGVLNKIEENGYNTLIFHVRTHNNALYPSSLSPKSTDISIIDFNNFDPLEWLINETHKRGIEFHAWLNPYRMGSRHVGTIPSANPASNSSNILTSTKGEQILDPAKRAVKTFVADTVNEIITNYDVDAIHFDDYFYVTTPSGYPFNESEKRGHVNDMVEGVYNTIQAYNANFNKHIQFGISPTGIYRNGNGNVYYSNGKVVSTGSNKTTGQQHYGNYLCADTLHWMNEGWLDYIMPQIYWERTNSAAPYKTVLDWWNEVCSYLDVNLYVGLGLYRSDEVWGNDSYELSAQMTLIENSTDAQGYSIFSYKHFKDVGTSSLFGIQMNNAFNINPKRKKISVLPVIKSMTPIIPNGVSSAHSNGTLNWTSSSDAKFYYLYRSTGRVTYSDEEIFAVVGKDIHSYKTNDYSNTYNYGVKVLSPTNHLSGQSIDEPIQTYTINYVLNGGSLVSGYTNRDDMLKDFFTDVHSYLNPGMSYNDFVHGVGKTSGYDGVYDNAEYFDNLYELNNENIVPTSIKFVNQAEYNKWVPLFDLIDEYVKVINPSQGFWKSYFEGRARIKNFMKKDTYNKEAANGLVNKIPDDLTQELVYSYTKETPDIILPTATKQGQTFLGWYDNYNYSGSPVTKILKGSTGDKTFYARWQGDTPIIPKYTVSFNLGYNNLKLPSVQVEAGKKVNRPTNPTRSGYTFLGWLYGTQDFSFNTAINQDITLTANWLKNDDPTDKITVTFDHGYDRIEHFVQVEEGHKVTKPADPIRSGYNFLGWYFLDDLYNFNSPVQFSIRLTAKWQKINDPVDTVTVTFDHGYNNFKEEVKVVRDTKIIEPPNPTRSGYDFLGWYILDDLYNFDNLVLYSMKLTAKWKKIENGKDYVTVTFNHAYDNKKTTADTIINTPVQKPKDPVREGYRFKGWYFVNELYDFETQVDYDITLTAHWEKIPEVIDTVTITFIYGYDDREEKLQVTKDEPLINPPIPNRAGYEFLGWYLSNQLYDFSKPISYSTTLLAKWEEVEPTNDYVTVTFDYNYDDLKETSQIIRTQPVNKPFDPVREGYRFKGWYFVNELYDFETQVDYDITLIAYWEKTSAYTISFNYHNNLPNTFKTVAHGEKLKRPLTPYKKGYLFNGWFLNGEKYDFNEKVTNDLTLDATWKTLAELENVSIFDKTYIRSAEKGVKEGLRFYAILENKYLNNEHGFYLIYGTTSKTELISAIYSDGIINNKKVVKVNVKDTLSDGSYSVVLTGIPKDYYDGFITVAPYVVDNFGKTIIADEFKISTVNYAKDQMLANQESVQKFVVTIEGFKKRWNFKED